jgi:hypothetical protein
MARAESHSTADDSGEEDFPARSGQIRLEARYALGNGVKGGFLGVDRLGRSLAAA